MVVASLGQAKRIRIAPGGKACRQMEDRLLCSPLFNHLYLSIPLGSSFPRDTTSRDPVASIGGCRHVHCKTVAVLGNASGRRMTTNRASVDAYLVHVCRTELHGQNVAMATKP